MCLPRTCVCVGVWRRSVLVSYLRVCGCLEEKCISLVPACGWLSGGEICQPPTCVWVSVGKRNVSASYLHVGGCWEEKCVSLLPACG